MRNVRFAAILLVIFGSANFLWAQQPADTEGKKPLTPEASLNIHFLSDLQLAPDGSRLAFVVFEAPKGERRAQHLWMYDKKTGGARQFTYSSKSETYPRWSPDGTRVAFVRRPGKGGEQRQRVGLVANGIERRDRLRPDAPRDREPLFGEPRGERFSERSLVPAAPRQGLLA